MTLTTREWWTALHGMFLGTAFLLSFTGSAAILWNLRSEWTTPAGRVGAFRLLIAGTWSMAILAWLAVSVGTFVIYPWYRTAAPKGSTAGALAAYPKALLISKPETRRWHEFGMVNGRNMSAGSRRSLPRASRRSPRIFAERLQAKSIFARRCLFFSSQPSSQPPLPDCSVHSLTRWPRSDKARQGDAVTNPSDLSAEAQNGAAWAALLSAGIGGLGFGILTDISECSPSASKLLLKVYPPAGSLSGVAVCSVLVWIAVWMALHARWHRRQIHHQRTMVVVIVLLTLAALVTTFPPFYESMGG